MKSLVPASKLLGSWRVSALGCVRTSRSTRRSRVLEAAFTLLELLVVVSIVAILAGLVLSTLGYVNRKGAASRAQSEVAALAAAIDSYHLEFGAYPAPADLYTELTGGGPINTDKVFFEPTPGMVNTNSTPRVFQDPYGQRYNYSTNPTRNVGFFDLWSVPPTANTEADWIHN